ncbi:MAG TPA: macro domain-containing protein [Micromonosporaceae bacterium]|nr:macro domain-containing protein [Micromonosporaceae bacterium]
MANNIDAFVAVVGIIVGSLALATGVVMILRQRRSSSVPTTHTPHVLPVPGIGGQSQSEPIVADPQVWAAELKSAGPKTRRIGVITGDMKLVKRVHVWVNSENTDMQMPRIKEGSTSAMIRLLGSKLDEAGNVEVDTILHDLERVVDGKTPVAPGTAFSTTSGALKRSHNVRYLIHVAAVQGEPGEGYRQIRDIGRCVTNALTLGDLRAREGVTATSILFPILGVGVGRGPLEPTVHALISAAVSYLEATEDTTFDDVYFLGYWEHERDVLFRVIDATDKLGPRYRQDLMGDGSH